MQTATCSLEPENNFFDLPLNTLLEIKNTWNAHSSTCINVSSADILQFAIFFAATRQKENPESLFSGTSTANAKRETLKNEFFWGRPDEKECDIMWVENLPALNSARGGPISKRCTLAGGEIKDKMIDRNGFTAGMIVLTASLIIECDLLSFICFFSLLYFTEEASALIGAHTIGLIRNTFGASLAGPVRIDMHTCRVSARRLSLIIILFVMSSGSITVGMIQHLVSEVHFLTYSYIEYILTHNYLLLSCCSFFAS